MQNPRLHRQTGEFNLNLTLEGFLTCHFIKVFKVLRVFKVGRRVSRAVLFGSLRSADDIWSSAIRSRGRHDACRCKVGREGFSLRTLKSLRSLRSLKTLCRRGIMHLRPLFLFLASYPISPVLSPPRFFLLVGYFSSSSVIPRRRRGSRRRRGTCPPSSSRCRGAPSSSGVPCRARGTRISFHAERSVCRVRFVA